MARARGVTHSFDRYAAEVERRSALGQGAGPGLHFVGCMPPLLTIRNWRLPPRRGTRKPSCLGRGAPRCRAPRARSGVHLGALGRQRSGDDLGRGGGCIRADTALHRGDEPQRAPPAGDRVVRHDDAPSQRWPVHARYRPRDRSSVRCLRIPRITTAQMEDFAGLMRRLWNGETVIGHDGPAGRYPVLRLDPTFREEIPLGSWRSARTRWSWEVGRSTRSCCTRSSPTRPWSAAPAR